MFKDKLFLLSVIEVVKYLPNDVNRKIHNYDPACKFWLLRSSSTHANRIACVYNYGVINRFGAYYQTVGVIRPALYVKRDYLKTLERTPEGDVMLGERKWLVLDEQKGLLILKETEYYSRFDKHRNIYKTSEVRKYLNRTLFYEMFTDVEREMIVDAFIDGEMSYPVE